jgi:hypothetical protein
MGPKFATKRREKKVTYRGGWLPGGVRRVDMCLVAVLATKVRRRKKRKAGRERRTKLGGRG